MLNHNINNGNTISIGDIDNKENKDHDKHYDKNLYQNNLYENNYNLAIFEKEDTVKIGNLIEHLNGEDSSIKNLDIKIRIKVITCLESIHGAIESGESEKQTLEIYNFKTLLLTNLGSPSEEVKKGLVSGSEIVGMTDNTMKLLGWA